VNEDGFDDLLIGSPGNASGFYEGRVTLLFGSSAMPDTIELCSSAFEAMGMKRFYGEYTHGQLGWRVAIGDLNGDSVEELIMSAAVGDPQGCDNCGELYVISWDPNLPDSVHVGSTAVPIKRLFGSGTLTLFGFELSAVDVTGDGRDDILLRSEPDQYIPTDVAKVTVVYGAPALRDSIFLATDTLVTRFLAEHRQDDLGRGLGAGDINNDGVIDVLIGANGASPFGRFIAGKAYVFYGISAPSGIDESRRIPALTLFQNHPNPFASTTLIEYDLRDPSPVTVTIYNVRGQRVVEVVMPMQSRGHHRLNWNGLDDLGRSLASGIYFYEVRASGAAQSKKMLLLR
jgi:hypothetical protein